MREINNQACERADDLIAFLYRELSEKETRNFERHLRDCSTCERDLGAFGQIRESIVSWRDASLGTAWSSSNVKESLHPASETQPGHSALAAIREFFNLSPVWMKGAVAFASLLLCVCAILATFYLRGRQANVVRLPNDKIYSQQELDRQVAQAVQRKADEIRNQVQSPQESDFAVNAGPRKKSGSRPGQFREAGYAANTQSLRKPLTRQERLELAADLGLLSSRDDDDLDLVGDKITQTP